MVYLIAVLLMLVPGMAVADPLTVMVASMSAGASFGSAFWAAFGTSLTELGASLLLSAAVQDLTRRSSKMMREMTLPSSLPVWRHAYGKCWATGTPAGVRVKDDILYGCWLLNSRPSEGPFTIFLDKRAVELSGDPYDFAGAGAVGTNGKFDGYSRFWIGKGDQTTCPAQIVAEFPEEFQSTDAWQGCTVLWMRLKAGKAKQRAGRWPSTPPEVMVDGFWSRVWDPRDVAQDPDDPDTWEWSANQALCVLDALRQNPLTPYDLRHLWMETITWAADVADEAAPVKGGGTIPRYEVNGTLAFADGAELEDQLQPLLDAGAARFVRARGQLGLIPACAQDVALTLTVPDILDGQPPQFVRYSSRDALATEVSAKYLAPDRAYEETSAPTYVIAGAQAEDGGLARLIQPDLSLVTDHRQVQRVQKIMAMRARMQRGVSGEFSPAAFDLVGGSWAALALGAPFASWDRTYEVESIAPALPGDDEGVALRCAMVLRETSAAVYAWDAETEEQDVAPYEFDGEISVLPPGGAITATTGASVAIDTGFGIVARVLFAFAPSTAASVESYEWQYRVDGGAWVDGGAIDSEVDDGTGDVFGYVSPAASGATYDIRVLARSSLMVSVWVYSYGTVASTGAERYIADFDAASYEVDGVAVTRAQVLTLTRASTATYIDASGVLQVAAVDAVRIDHALGTPALLIEPSRTNDLLRSAELDNAYWSKVRAAVTANTVTAPDGTLTADTLTDDTATGTHQIYRNAYAGWVSGQVYGLSVFAKAGTLDEVALQLGASGSVFPTGANWRAVFDLTAGTILSAGSNITAQIIALAGGWHHIGIIGTAQATAAESCNLAFLCSGGVPSYTGTGTGTVHLWGGQLEVGGVSSYIPTAAAAVTRAADVATMAGITATLDLALTYGDGTTGAIAGAPVSPSYWPTLAKTRLRRLVGTP